MSIQLMISALRRGNTGNEILSILDAILSDDYTTSSENSSYGEPTGSWIEF